MPPLNFTAGDTHVAVTPLSIAQDAYTEIGHLAQGETLSSADLAWGLNKLQRIIDMLGAKRGFIYTTGFDLYTLIPNHGPHTIGPSGDFNVPQRPVRLESASVIIPNGVDLPLEVVGKDRWAAERLKSLTSNFPMYVYYSPDVPNGTLNFWPIATDAYQVRLETYTSIGQAINATTPITLPPAYWEYLVLKLAVSMTPGDAAGANPILMEQLREATKAVMTNNDAPPRLNLSTTLPVGNRRSVKPDWNYVTGLRE